MEYNTATSEPIVKHIQYVKEDKCIILSIIILLRKGKTTVAMKVG